MRLYEYQSKMILAEYGIPIPRGRITSTASEAKQIADELGGRVVVKSQVLTSGRGKAGGILLAKNPREAQELVTQLLSMEIKGFPVRRVLVDEAVTIANTWYLGIMIDRQERTPVMVASGLKANGVDNQAIDSDLVKVLINPLLGLKDYQVRDIAASIGLPRQHWRSFMRVAHGLWRAFLRMDATLVEIKPLVITSDQRMLALDALLVVDDNASFRHPEFADFWDLGLAVAPEVEARKFGLQYVKLTGQVGCMVNGAGLTMAVMDLISYFNGSPANFLDVGGGATPEKVAAGFRILLSDMDLRSIVVNIFGGVTRCDDVAQGMVSAMNDIKPRVPIVVRMAGTHAGDAMKLLEASQLVTAETMVDAVQKAVAFSVGGWNGYLD